MRFFVEGIPRPQGSKSPFGRGKKIILVEASKYIKAWRNKIAAVAKQEWTQAPLLGGVRVCLEFRMPRPKAHYNSKGELKEKFRVFPHTKRPDVDKLIRGVLDAITGICFVDDSQVAKVSGVKRYDEIPGVYIEVHNEH